LLTSEEGTLAVKELKRKEVVSTLLYLNRVRDSADLAREPEYQRRFNGYYRVRQQPARFYDAFYELLYFSASAPESATLDNLLQNLYESSGKRRLSFCSKLLATVRDDAVVFDCNVASYFGLRASPLPKSGWMDAALRRYNYVREKVALFVSDSGWPVVRATFDGAFPEASHLPCIRKGDLLIWAHVGLRN
jgi:hypothetical protein